MARILSWLTLLAVTLEILFVPALTLTRIMEAATVLLTVLSWFLLGRISAQREHIAFLTWLREQREKQGAA